MKRILLGTSLLLAAGLCGQSAQADPTYAAHTTLVSPASATVTLVYPQVRYPVTYSVINQSVEVNGAVPSSKISVGWAISQQVNGQTMTQDASGGMVSVSTDASGHWQHYLNNTPPGNLSQNLLLGGGSNQFISTAGLAAPNGQNYITSAGATVVVSDPII